MSALQMLIRERCPAGVPFRRLGELLDYEQPGKYLVTSTDYDDSYPTPVLTAGRTFVLGYTNETHGIYPASPESPVIIFDDFTTAFKWVDFPFKAKSSAMKMLTPKPGVSLRFLWFAMQTIRYLNSTQEHARQWIGTYSKLEVPFPPADVQEEVVRLLDLFHGAESDLEAALKAELAARQRQHAYCRDELLSFREAESVRWIPMGQVGMFIRGRRFTKNDMVPIGIPSIHYGEIYTHYGVSARETLSHVRNDLAGNLRYARPGDVVIAGVGETVEDVAKAVAWLGDTEVAIHDDSFAFRSEQNPVYISYVMQTAAYQVQKEKQVARAKVKRVGGENLGKILIPVPSLDEQRRIVSTLERLDALMDDLSNGLEAELGARRLQYEHYRDRLLAFQEET